MGNFVTVTPMMRVLYRLFASALLCATLLCWHSSSATAQSGLQWQTWKDINQGGMMTIQLTNAGQWSLGLKDSVTGSPVMPIIMGSGWSMSGPNLVAAGNNTSPGGTVTPIQLRYFNLVPGRKYILSAEPGINYFPSTASYRHPIHIVASTNPVTGESLSSSQFGSASPNLALSINTAQNVTFAYRQVLSGGGYGPTFFQQKTTVWNGQRYVANSLVSDPAYGANCAPGGIYEYSIVYTWQSSGFSFSASQRVSSLTTLY